ncbi:hypothetical protein BS47DRAFT_1395368 [Hydnum rufescens UP504]|uniref:Uncharacterized protein n=1 Tax=Hydnum rufescens UP504 TaxID=1448309 RepID=A0A9P6DTY9_9AGAM|nr:hypothetical protein BS47DRAFT_1395368 [Hydnum rufescens UP504]
MAPPAANLPSIAHRPHTIHEESTTPTPSTPPRRKYPTTLSRISGTDKLAHRRGTSKQYETLEDLLTAAGYKETRIFTPEAERVGHDAGGISPETMGKEDGPSRGNSLGTFMTNILSSWIPGASVSLGRAKGAEIARREATSIREEEEEGDENDPRFLNPRPLARKSAHHKSDNSWRAPRTSYRPPLPTDFIADSRGAGIAGVSRPGVSPQYPPSHSPTPLSKTVVNRQLPRLRQVISSPNFHRPKLGGRPGMDTRTHSQIDQDPRGRPSLSNNGVAPKRLQPHRSVTSIHTHSHQGRPNHDKPIITTITSSITPLEPILNSSDVVCRSAPGSRSASRNRPSDRAPPLPPLLSPSLLEEGISAWMEGSHPLKQRHASDQSSCTGSHDDDDDDVEDSGDPGLAQIIYSRIERDASSQSSSSSGHQSTSFFTRPSLSPPARRQRSIQSLRAHLVPRPQPSMAPFPPSLRKQSSFRNPIFTVATPRTAEAHLPGRGVWLDGPEWDGAVHQPSIRGGTGNGKAGSVG